MYSDDNRDPARGDPRRPKDSLRHQIEEDLEEYELELERAAQEDRETAD